MTAWAGRTVSLIPVPLAARSAAPGAPQAPSSLAGATVVMNTVRIGRPLLWAGIVGVNVAAFILLSQKGFLFVIQVDGTGSTPGRTLFENYTFSWNPSHEHNVQLTDKNLSGTFTLSQALEGRRELDAK